MPSSPKRISSLRKVVGFIVMVVLMAIAFAFSAGALRTFEIMSESMTPTLQIGDRLFVDARGPVRPHAGDIIAFRKPGNPSVLICKRVAAEPYDEVEFETAYLSINGKLQRPARYHLGDMIPRDGNYYLKLGADEYYVLGDNEAFSNDSRDFGPVSESDMVGAVTRIYWPFARAISLKNHSD